jgi:hypothetical protein
VHPQPLTPNLFLTQMGERVTIQLMSTRRGRATTRTVYWEWRLCASRTAALLCAEDRVRSRVYELTMSRAIQVRFAPFYDAAHTTPDLSIAAQVKERIAASGNKLW